MFFVKLKNSDNAVVIKIFEWLNIQTNELQIDYLVRLIKWTYDGFLMNPDGKENPAFEGRWRSKDDLNPGYSDDDPIKQRKLLVFTLYEDKVPVENLIVDFQRCYLHVRTNHPSTYSESDRQSNFVYKAILKTSNPEEVDIVQEFKIVLIQNPNIYETSLTNKKIYKDPSDLEEWVFEYYYHFDRKGHSLAVQTTLTTSEKPTSELELKFDQYLENFYPEVLPTDTQGGEHKRPFFFGSRSNFNSLKMNSYMLSVQENGRNSSVDIFEGGKLKESLIIDEQRESEIDLILDFDINYYVGSEEQCLVSLINRIYLNSEGKYSHTLPAIKHKLISQEYWKFTPVNGDPFKILSTSTKPQLDLPVNKRFTQILIQGKDGCVMEKKFKCA